jgi:predicted transposase YbfD/YdcC
MDAPQYSSLAAALAAVPDPRAARGRRYRWSTLLTFCAVALLSGQQHVRAIAHWTQLHAAEWQTLLPDAPARVPSLATFYRAVRLIDLPALQAQVAAFSAQAAAPPAGLTGLALDGKAVRGAHAHGLPCHLLTLATAPTSAVLGQVQLARKANELSTAPALLAGRNLAGWVVTADAAFAAVALARQIRAQGGHYLFVVKANQPTLRADIALLFRRAPGDARTRPAGYGRYRSLEKGHGRLEQRTLETSTGLNSYLDWPDVGQVLRRTCWRREVQGGRESRGVWYAITSVTPAEAPPARVEGFWRGHWGIENRLFFVRDETLGEDRGQGHVGSVAGALAMLRNGVLCLLRQAGWGNIAEGVRTYAASLPAAYALVTGVRL